MRIKTIGRPSHVSMQIIKKAAYFYGKYLIGGGKLFNNIKLTISNLINELYNDMDMNLLFESKIYKLKNKYEYLINNIIDINNEINKIEI